MLKLRDFQPSPYNPRNQFPCSVLVLLNLSIPNSASVAAFIGVMGGWSPASWPFLGRLMPSDSNAFTW